MRFALILLFAFTFNSAFTQAIPQNIYKTWVLNKLTYKDGSALPDDNPLKYAYLKYTFEYPNKFGASFAYIITGTDRSFDVKDGTLLLNSAEGTVINTLKIMALGDQLVLLQPGIEGIDDPTSLVYSFVPEHIYQDSIKLLPKDVLTVNNGDTTYIASPKIYASYKGGNLQQYIQEGIANHINMHNRAVHFVATFIVTKTGIADSLKIIENADPEFDKRVIKTFNQVKKDWKPAILNGKHVDILMKIELRYSTSATALPNYFAAQKGLVAYNEKRYDVALYFYDKAVESDPADKESLYRRGMCKMLLGNKTGACEDWNKAKATGSNTTIDAVLEKYCK